jgi:SAM-dependent methyltransferase
MLKDSAPRAYVTTEYLEYQRKYSENIRDSDRVLINLIRTKAVNAVSDSAGLRVLDIGCSNGNLLRHLKRLFPDFAYRGGDLFPEIIAHCKSDPDLAGIAFQVMDMRELEAVEPADIVIVNAVLGRFADSEFKLVLQNLSRVVAPGGHLFGFEWFHPFEQKLSIAETSVEHPEGLTLIFRAYAEVSALARDAGFEDSWFEPFQISIDLEKPADPQDIRTYTVATQEGSRLNFRGSLFLPWCHWGARKLRS